MKNEKLAMNREKGKRKNEQLRMRKKAPDRRYRPKGRVPPNEAGIRWRGAYVPPWQMEKTQRQL
jgi:hypothetical protein